MSAAELATQVTAARAVRGDFERAALTAGPGEDWLSWALRLAEHLGQVLDVIGQPPPVVLPANQSDCFRDMLADAETYRSKGVAGSCKDWTPVLLPCAGTTRPTSTVSTRTTSWPARLGSRCGNDRGSRSRPAVHGAGGTAHGARVLAPRWPPVRVPAWHYPARGASSDDRCRPGPYPKASLGQAELHLSPED